MSVKPPSHIAVLGGGLTGLTAAYTLAKARAQDPALAAIRLTLFEQSKRVGGWVDSRPTLINGLGDHEKPGSIVLETGPRSIRPRGSPGAVKMLKLIQDIGLQSKILDVPNDHPAAKNRYLLNPSTHRLTKLPSSLTDMLSYPKPPLIKGIFGSMLREPFAKTRPPYITDPDQANYIGEDESVDSLVRRRLGDSIADNLISAMIHGIFACDSRKLSVRMGLPLLWDAEKIRGSIVMGMFRGVKDKAEKAREQAEWDELDGGLGKTREGWSLYGLKGGIGTLTDRLSEEVKRLGVDIVQGAEVEGIKQTDDGMEIAFAGKTPAIQVSNVISTLSPSTMSRLLPSTTTLPHLTHNPSTTVGVINLVFPHPPGSIHPPGFGYLVPRSPITGSNPSGILGVVFDSTAIEDLDPHAKGLTKLTVMIGGPHWTTYPANPTRPEFGPIPRPDVGELTGLALQHLHEVFPEARRLLRPVFHQANIWKDCIPTYLVGHRERMRELELAAHASGLAGNLILTGSGYAGVGVNDCVLMGEQAGLGMMKWLKDGGLAPTGLDRFRTMPAGAYV